MTELVANFKRRHDQIQLPSLRRRSSREAIGRWPQCALPEMP